MQLLLLTGCLVLTLLKLGDSTLTINPTFTKATTIIEGTATNKILTTIDCKDSDGDLTFVSVKSTFPVSPCTYCFEVLKCGTAACLQYRAGVGTLDYTSAPSYLVTVSCTDNKETPVTEVIEVVVIPNSPPYFVPDALNVSSTMASSLSAGQVVYTVVAKDNETDSLTYTLKVMPTSSSDNYEINKFTGAIKTKVPLKAECRSDVTFLVTVNDGKNTVGPLVIDEVIKNPNTAPVAVNLDTTIQVPENTSGTVFTMLMNDANKDQLTYTITTTSSAGLAQFQINNATGVIDVGKALDYENTGLRLTDLVVQAWDGYCSSPKYQLHLQVTDVNEPPTISPDVINMDVCEGKKTFSPGYKVTDPDASDTQRWYFDKSNSDPNGYFNIDAKTGDLMTLLDYDVDPLKPMPVSNTFKVVVEDKGGLTATAKVTVNFLECNDHAPVFDAPGYEASASECSGAGSRLIRIRATDNDTSRDDNNVIYYQGSGGAVSVNSDGDVILNHPLPAGNVITFDAYAYDRGRTPSQLRSVNPTRISVRFTPCYTTNVPIVVPTPAPTVPTTPTTTLPTTTTAKTKQDSNLPWIVIAALLGSVMLALLACMLWRYGRLCAHACNNFSCEKKCCRPRPRRLTTPVARRPAERPNIEPEEKEEPPPKGPGFLFGFWKERFPDDDFKQEPQRKTLPAPGDMDAHYPHTIDAVEDPLTPQVTDTAPPKKKCVIM